MRLNGKMSVLTTVVVYDIAFWKIRLLTKGCTILFLCAREERVGSTLNLLARGHDVNQWSTLREGGILARVVNGADVDDRGSRSSHQWRI